MVLGMVEPVLQALAFAGRQAGGILRPEPCVAVDAEAELIIHRLGNLCGLRQVRSAASACTGGDSPEHQPFRSAARQVDGHLPIEIRL